MLCQHDPEIIRIVRESLRSEANLGYQVGLRFFGVGHARAGCAGPSGA